MKNILLPIGIGLWAATSMATQAADFAFACRISVPTRINAGAKVPLKFTLKNRSPGVVNVLTWNTPLEGLTGRFLSVTGPDGKEIEYGGPMVKRAPPARDNYIKLRKGATRQRTVDISRAYAFTQPGSYRIAFIGELTDVSPGAAKLPTPADKLAPHRVDCPAVTLTVR